MAMGQKATHDVEPETPAEKKAEKKLDLSAAQVAGSSLATVAAALLASKMGVYGTILGAGVVSVVATAGGPVIQHLFRRTGDQLRESARPRTREVPAPGGERAPDGTMTLRAAAPPDEEFGEATVHGTRVRGWKRTAVAAGAAFVISLGALGTYEAISDTSVSSGGGTIFSGGTRKVSHDEPAPSGSESGTGEKGERGEKGGKTPEPGTSPSPSRSQGGGSPSPDPSPSGSGGPGSGPLAVEADPDADTHAHPDPRHGHPDAFGRAERLLGQSPRLSCPRRAAGSRCRTPGPGRGGPAAR